MKHYEEAEFELVRFDSDVIATSTFGDTGIEDVECGSDDGEIDLDLLY